MTRIESSKEPCNEKDRRLRITSINGLELNLHVGKDKELASITMKIQKFPYMGFHSMKANKTEGSLFSRVSVFSSLWSSQQGGVDAVLKLRPSVSSGAVKELGENVV
ncbi:hypothetical protein VNO80_25251 [Phaseolus coccineus]|uniref:Uncharacterized protein n=1 Tax=Phaseolus coccineus TaxID=3886 RepID=A0AAN9QNL2_PHACN